MKRLIKFAKPRRSRKSIILTMKYTLKIKETDADKIKKIREMFISWMRDKFSTWDDTVLQYFLYDTHTEQNDKDDRLELEGHLDKILQDEEDIYKPIVITMKYVLDIHEDNDEENKRIGKKFIAWMRDKFSKWNQTILDYCFYDNNLKYEEDKEDLVLTSHLNTILKDDCTHMENREIEEMNLNNDNKDTSSSESTATPEISEDAV